MFLEVDVLAVEGPRFWCPPLFIIAAEDPFGLLPYRCGCGCCSGCGFPRFVAFTIVVSFSTPSVATDMPEHPSQDRMQAIACIDAPRMGGRGLLGCVT